MVHSAKQIAKQWGVAPYTVGSHTKSVVEEAGVGSRQQLVSALFFGHYLPRRKRNASPVPYGWFLEDDSESVVRVSRD